ncbi:HDOD domain-containing protein [Undibacterium curvum]|uniref:HDOD domain-containing protein n=1 Tax=Undibacterium curvum TaxID=2762294 RepID=A0ABR7A6G2_9BURK|nr:HDOD domain-containing protein [Undibacterium curvum]MBC3932495.1 HDOD domain-containing protein [Undibacterium curvum]
MNKSQALHHIVAETQRGELVFPTHVQASLHIQQALDDPECGIEAAARLIMKEPLMAARVVAIANSVAYSRFGGGVTNIRTAVSILGFSTLRSVVAAVIMRQISHQITEPVIRHKMESLWLHSAHVGALSYCLAKHVTLSDPETAMFTGIVHEVGGFYLLSRAEEFPALLEDTHCTPEHELDESPEIFIGRAVLHQLMVPKRVQSAIEVLWYGARALPPASLGEILIAANDLSPVPSPIDPRLPEQIEAARNSTDCSLNQHSLRDILQQTNTETQSLLQSLLH